MDTEALIVEIFNRPPIWSSKHPQHRLKNAVNRSWNEIKQCFPEYEVEQLRKKWKNLKDTYRKELKKYTTFPGDPEFEDDTPSQWKYFNNMSFLKDELFIAESKSNQKSKNQTTESVQEVKDLPNMKSEQRNIESTHEINEFSEIKIEYPSTEFEHEDEDLPNLKSEQPTVKIEYETIKVSNVKSENQNKESEHENENLKDVSSPSEEHTMSSPSPSRSPQPLNVSPQPCGSSSNIPNTSRKRLTPNDIRAEYLEIEKKKLKILEQEVARQNNIVTQNSPEKTDDYYYLMSLLPEMQKFTSIQKLRVRNKINQVLIDEMTLNIT